MSLPATPSKLFSKPSDVWAERPNGLSNQISSSLDDISPKAGESIILHKGDTHANILSLLETLENSGAITLSDELYNQFLAFEKSFNVYEPNEEKFYEQIRLFMSSVKQLKLNPDFFGAFLKLKGDNNGDRGNNDAWTDLILDALEMQVDESNQVTREGLIISDLHSDHGDFDIRPDQKLSDSLLKRSSKNYDLLKERIQIAENAGADLGGLSSEKLNQLKNKRLSRRKLIDYDSFIHGKKIAQFNFYSHGVVGPACLKAVAEKLGVTYSANNTIELCKTIDAINVAFKRLMDEPGQIKYKEIMAKEEQDGASVAGATPELFPFRNIMHSTGELKKADNTFDTWPFKLNDGILVQSHCAHIGQLSSTKEKAFKTNNPNVQNLDSDAGKIGTISVNKMRRYSTSKRESYDADINPGLSFFSDENNNIYYKLYSTPAYGEESQLIFEGTIANGSFAHEKLIGLLVKPSSHGENDDFYSLCAMDINGDLLSESKDREIFQIIAEFHPDVSFVRIGDPSSDKKVSSNPTRNVFVLASASPSFLHLKQFWQKEIAEGYLEQGMTLKSVDSELMTEERSQQEIAIYDALNTYADISQDTTFSSSEDFRSWKAQLIKLIKEFSNQSDLSINYVEFSETTARFRREKMLDSLFSDRTNQEDFSLLKEHLLNKSQLSNSTLQNGINICLEKAQQAKENNDIGNCQAYLKYMDNLLAFDKKFKHSDDSGYVLCLKKITQDLAGIENTQDNALALAQESLALLLKADNTDALKTLIVEEFKQLILNAKSNSEEKVNSAKENSPSQVPFWEQLISATSLKNDLSEFIENWSQSQNYDENSPFGLFDKILSENWNKDELPYEQSSNILCLIALHKLQSVKKKSLEIEKHSEELLKKLISVQGKLKNSAKFLLFIETVTTVLATEGIASNKYKNALVLLENSADTTLVNNFTGTISHVFFASDVDLKDLNSDIVKRQITELYSTSNSQYYLAQCTSDIKPLIKQYKEIQSKNSSQKTPYEDLLSVCLLTVFYNDIKNKTPLLNCLADISSLSIQKMPVYGNLTHANHPVLLLSNFTKASGVLSDNKASPEAKKAALETIILLQEIARIFTKEDMSNNAKRYYSPEVEKARRLNKILASNDLDLTTKEGQETIASFKDWLKYSAKTKPQTELEIKINKNLNKVTKPFYMSRIAPELKADWIEYFSKLAKLEATLANYPDNNILPPLSEAELKQLYKTAHKAKSLASYSHWTSFSQRDVDAAKVALELLTKTTDILIESYGAIGVEINEIKKRQGIDENTPCQIKHELQTKFEESSVTDNNSENSESENKDSEIINILGKIKELIEDRNSGIKTVVSSSEEKLNSSRGLKFLGSISNFVQKLFGKKMFDGETNTMQKVNKLQDTLTQSMFKPTKEEKNKTEIGGRITMNIGIKT